LDIYHKRDMDAHGIGHTWRNQSIEQRLIATIRKDTRRQRQAAEHRQERPTLPFHPTNPFDSRLVEHMASIGSVDEETTIRQRATASPSVITIEDDDIESSIISSAIISQQTPSIRSVQSQHMLPPSTTTSRISHRSSKRHRPRESLNTLQAAQDRVTALKRQVEEAKELQRLNLEEETLQKQLEELQR
jgi:hypothetical protein